MPYETSIGPDQRRFLGRPAPPMEELKAPRPEKPSRPDITKSTVVSIHKELPSTFCRLVVLSRSPIYSKLLSLEQAWARNGRAVWLLTSELNVALVTICRSFLRFSTLPSNILSGRFCSQRALHLITELGPPRFSEIYGAHPPVRGHPTILAS